ncbi:HAMP domain-containing sensor histidine kinase [Caulobacter rhizosphaerae]|uniref:HAMP domain-containing sensor histidine kinase n=1 Tax=Caulobacter rhizosphaerae TaxID=2010972 RepID=UPI0013D19C35|nr:HAMP domain-containing sensor histidine kinase [Caulobacter rhizosphaerae]GGL35783.1 two-component sensor histidine kinase [Caulobacter rhizosphaerae]
MIKSRLFWKIFTAFCLTYVAMVVATVLVFALVLPLRPAMERAYAESAGAKFVALAAAAVRDGGPQALASIDPTRRDANLFIVPVKAASPIRPPQTEGYATRVRAPNGETFRIFYRMPAPVRGRQPYELYAVGVVAGLVFATGLALYLSYPIRWLRAAFESFAQGDLTVRLRPRIGRRRDEVADLARDFDTMAERVARLITARDRLIDDISHELRSPLARLQLAAALARQNPDPASGALDRIDQEVRRLDAMVGELLSLSRMESGAPDPDRYFDLTEMIRDLVSDATFEAARKSVDVQLRITPAVAADQAEPSVRGEAELVRRALENLLRNAVRHAPTPSIVDVSLTYEPGWASIEVADRGPGAPTADLDSLFEPFKSGPGGGFGLGLSIARRTILAHGGSIALGNRPGGGFLVRTFLPTLILGQG